MKKSDWILNSPSGSWTVTPVDKEKLEVENSISTNNSSQEKVGSNKYISSTESNFNTISTVKKQLSFKENTVENPSNDNFSTRYSIFYILYNCTLIIFDFKGSNVKNKLTTIQSSTIENILTLLKGKNIIIIE